MGAERSLVAQMPDAPQPRLFPVVGDYLEPQLQGRRDFVLVVPADRFVWDAMYVMDFDGDETVYIASTRVSGGRHIRHPNPKYGDGYELSREAFDAHVRGVVVGEVKMALHLEVIQRELLNGRCAA